MHTKKKRSKAAKVAATQSPPSPQSPPEWMPSEKELKQHVALKESGGVPLPGPLLEAFADGSRKVRIGKATLTLRPMVASDLIVLQQIGSPLITVAKVLTATADQDAKVRRQAIEDAYKPMKGETAFQASARLDIETVETFFIWTKSPADLRALLAKGRDVFREEALKLLDTIPPSGMEIVRFAAGAHFASGFATQVAYESDAGDGSFPSPPPATGSVGG